MLKAKKLGGGMWRNKASLHNTWKVSFIIIVKCNTVILVKLEYVFQMFEQVTILFSYIVDFADICAEASAMQIVKCINAVFTCFDAVVDKYDVFKVQKVHLTLHMYV